MTVKILYHAHCFDGFSSAAMFTRFYRDVIDSKADFSYEGLKHDGPNILDPRIFDADIHAIVDFRYSASEKLDWWFDHHASAFVNESERAHFSAANNPQHFWDPAAPSCCGYLAKIAQEKFGFNTASLSQIIEWANLIDTAGYKSADAAVELAEPALQLMSVLEHLGDGELAVNIIEQLSHGALDEVANCDAVKERFKPIQIQQQTAINVVRQNSTLLGDTLLVDLTGGGPLVYNKFAPYYLHPEIVYAVVITQTPNRIRLSVGSNPWRREARRHNIAEICEQYGGGGHAVVGGITIDNLDTQNALSIGHEIVSQLAI